MFKYTNFQKAHFHHTMKLSLLQILILLMMVLVYKMILIKDERACKGLYLNEIKSERPERFLLFTWY